MWPNLAADLRANVDPRHHAGARYWLRVLGKALVTPQVQVVILFRIGSTLARTPLRPVAFLLRAWSVTLGGADIHPDAKIGPGFALIHSVGVVIGPGVVIGRDCRLAQGVTLGHPDRGAPLASETDGVPALGDHVTMGAHAVALGPCRIGSGAVIGANAVVTSDIPELTLAVGAPARAIRPVDVSDILPGSTSL